MTDFNMVALYVKDPLATAALYEDLLGRPIVQSSPRFVVLQIGKGALLGLWERGNVEPRAGNEIGGAEIAFAVASADAVGEAYTAWKGRGLKIAQEPTAMNFGYTFVALDPDGHRLRVFAPAGP
jgi:catechol 2,3-dioxygenase-like lactoylglutathione lyase family enzyme